jgi:hypothetical protein
MHGQTPLQPDDLIANYTTGRAVVRRWRNNRELDRVSATLHLLKNFLRSDHNYYMILTNETHKRHVRMFFSDLPGDIARKMRKWLKDHAREDLEFPEDPE